MSSTVSRIEQLIDEIENFIDGCKYQALSNTKILVNKEEMEELLVELRMRVPEEIKKYQKIVNQQDAILEDARHQAEAMISDATIQTNGMVDEHEITQRATERANEILEDARMEAQDIVNAAISDANEIRQGAVQYTDELLASVQNIVSNTANESQQRFNGMMDVLEQTFNICQQNRSSLYQSAPDNGYNGDKTQESQLEM
ncbi:MAG: vacuolar family H+-ATPase subunit H [Eubacteriales bacterium]|nr:vacuolar family H+-ATPase subunit H [Eubacteriales bacterium]